MASFQGSARKSFFRKSLRNPRTSATVHSATCGEFWTFSIFDTYIKVSNTQEIYVDSASTSQLPCVPNLTTILQEKFYDFSFSTLSFGGNCSQIVFLMVGSQTNSVIVNHVIITSSRNEIPIQIRSPLTENVKIGDLILYIFPVTLVKPHGMYLRITKDENPTRASATCSQECAHLTSKEPQVFLCGHVTLSDGYQNPFMLAQRTEPFVKKYCRIHSTQGEVCPVNSLKKSKHFIRMSIEQSFLRGDLTACLKVGMTMVEHALISFKYNPYVFTPWKWGSLYTPIYYAGPPVIIPAGQSTQIFFTNMYYASLLSEITALITNSNENSTFQILDCEWSPKSHAIITVKNLTCYLQLLKKGEFLGQAFFFIAPKLPMDSIIPTKYKENLSAAFTMSGGITINATKLHKLSKMCNHTSQHV